jgi:protein-tyrosine-phosphatase
MDVNVKSAGLASNPGQRVAENAVIVMRELGIDISNEYSKPVDPQLVAWATAIVPVQKRHAEYLMCRKSAF